MPITTAGSQAVNSGSFAFILLGACYTLRVSACIMLYCQMHWDWVMTSDCTLYKFGWC